MCINQLLKNKFLFTFQPKNRPVFTTVKNAKPAAMFCIVLSGTKKQQLCCLAAMAHIVLSKRQFVTTKMKNSLIL